MNSLTESILVDTLQPMAGQSAMAVEANIHLMADRMMGLALDSRLTGDETVVAEEDVQPTEGEEQQVDGEPQPTEDAALPAAEGDLKSPIDVKRSGDEVEVLSSSLKTTIESVNGYLTEIQRVLDNIFRGNLNVSADGEYQGDFVVVKESLTQIIESMNQMMKQINQTAFSLMQTAENIGDQSEELHQAVVNQTEAMLGLNSEVENIKDNSDIRTGDGRVDGETSCQSYFPSV